MFLDLLREQFAIFDGAMGTSIQNHKLDTRGKCNEYLNLIAPDSIAAIHAEFIAAGAMVIETNTFSGTAGVLAEYGLADDVYDINYAGAKLAANLALDVPQACFVSGSVGPGTKLPSLNQVSYEQLFEQYRLQIEALVDGGVDLIQIETCQDMLQLKCAVAAAYQVFTQKRKKLPVIAQVTLQENGSMLLGTDIATAMHTLMGMNVDVIGMNCGTGPAAILPHVQTLARMCPRPISVLPNAGIPKLIDGRLQYDMSPRDFAAQVAAFVTAHGIEIVGGCCGTTPEHIRELARSLDGVHRPQRAPDYHPSICSLYSSVQLDTEPKPLMIGEKTNTYGSRKFKKALHAENWDKMVEIASDQIREGAHLCDVCLASLERNEAEDAAQFVSLLNKSLQIPIMIDTTSIDTVKATLKNYGGKPVINSVNFESGDEKVAQYLELARQYGAVVICLAIDEDGMAQSAEHKIDILKRFIKLASFAEPIVFDCLTFSLATGEEQYRNSAIESIEAIRLITKHYPEVTSLMGVSNVSFGLAKNIRKILNSVFLYECVKAGLGAAIVDAGKIQPLHGIDPAHIELCQNLIYNRAVDGADPLEALIAQLSDVSEVVVEQQEQSLEAQLKTKVISGNKTDLVPLLDKLLIDRSPLQIISEILLVAMTETGELFAEGKLQLPFVLKAAEVMKQCVNYLEQFFEKKPGSEKILLATVQGDVHDIGKNLAGIILENNGFEIIDIGVKQTPQMILDAIRKHEPDYLGLSALLIKSTMIMKDTLIYLKNNGVSLTVFCGGAALSEKYVRNELKSSYGDNVIYARDAFAASSYINTRTEQVSVTAHSELPTKKKNIELAGDIPVAPFLGTGQARRVSFDEAFNCLNRRFLYAQWKLHPRKLKEDSALAAEMEARLADFCALGKDIFDLRAVHGYYACYANGEDLHLIDEQSVLHFPRSQYSLADFFDSTSDVCAFQLVTLGERFREYSAKLKKSEQYQDYFLWNGFCAAITEALAEFNHSLIRSELGFADSGRSKRFSFGYNCCPDMAQQQIALDLLHADRLGVSGNESYQLEPEFSTCAIIVHHPSAFYW
ncbi:MAG: homocysteine S-methyltransferase family protein [Candidatus Cloacimonetes bacterium]|nr:homocysteine S-methyltransferase family protein [Candidatus Cloacimonadota bacterium]